MEIRSRVIEVNVFQCKKCKKEGLQQSPYIVRVKGNYEFRRRARDVFGWSALD